jgi:putative transposase
VEEEPYLWAVIRYREQNPVRAKLVKQAEDDHWSSARAHILGIRDDILSTESWFDKKPDWTLLEDLTRKDLCR